MSLSLLGTHLETYPTVTLYTESLKKAEVYWHNKANFRADNKTVVQLSLVTEMVGKREMTDI